MLVCDGEMINRKQIRLREYDYSRAGAYFVTICTYERKALFGIVSDGRILCNQYGETAVREIRKTNELRGGNGIQIVKYVVMPNHVHMLIEIQPKEPWETDFQSHVQKTEVFEDFSKPTKQSVSTVVRAYKAAVTREIHKIKKNADDRNGHDTSCPYEKFAVGPVWQGRFFEHIIRNKEDYCRIWKYIDDNPMLWEKDCFYSKVDY